MGAECLEKKGSKLKNAIKNVLNQVCKMHKIPQFPQKYVSVADLVAGNYFMSS